MTTEAARSCSRVLRARRHGDMSGVAPQDAHFSSSRARSVTRSTRSARWSTPVTRLLRACRCYRRASGTGPARSRRRANGARPRQLQDSGRARALGADKFPDAAPQLPRVRHLLREVDLAASLSVVLSLRGPSSVSPEPRAPEPRAIHADWSAFAASVLPSLSTLSSPRTRNTVHPVACCAIVAGAAGGPSSGLEVESGSPADDQKGRAR